ncbi:MAG: hypothetical protein ACMXYK_00895 [Candidatus Woesearchaeota archaeon]
MSPQLEKIRKGCEDLVIELDTYAFAANDRMISERDFLSVLSNSGLHIIGSKGSVYNPSVVENLVYAQRKPGHFILQPSVACPLTDVSFTRNDKIAKKNNMLVDIVNKGNDPFVRATIEQLSDSTSIPTVYLKLLQPDTKGYANGMFDHILREEGHVLNYDFEWGRYVPV